MLPESHLRTATRRDGGVSRRTLLTYASALAATPILGRAATVHCPRTFRADPFTLGVASGDPDAGGMVLWTRLAPSPLEPGGGLAPEALEVSWEVAEDEAMVRVVASGTTVATPQLGHSVHVLSLIHI